MIQKNSRTGMIFKNLRTDVQRPITAILVLNTIANTAGASIAGSYALLVLGHEWLGLFSAMFTLSILIFSEIVPKTVGVVYSKALCPLVAYPLRGLVWFMAPAIWFCSHITGVITRAKKPDLISPEELKVMATLSLKSGGIKPFQKSVIDNILTLDKKTVKDVMTPRTVIFSMSEHLTLEEASRMSKVWEHSRFPVYDKDREDIVGIVLTKELFISLAQGKGNMLLTDLMRPAHFVVETARLNKVLMEFIESRQKLFVVLDEYGGIAGIITLEDILEEILGREIVDESDQVVDKRELARKRRKDLISGL
jgi:CBS domain containing-hemolysin-like protein